ncbi:hypothetical protein BOTBODRAFT_182400 [Botryobasidium botryosum FD-172 SS1]|uniref:Uncharacterized protein n=1 Tax=Botryobasidium botryosum (strain FD-172 SS1) TaxID=930990 RepID=A0A067M137_BOTB1|nr:hypothetical protein BOTBODRAFT_182400 [Botryobasidium botryosum FD-172 SS1]
MSFTRSRVLERVANRVIDMEEKREAPLKDGRLDKVLAFSNAHPSAVKNQQRMIASPATTHPRVASIPKSLARSSKAAVSHSRTSIPPTFNPAKTNAIAWRALAANKAPMVGGYSCPKNTNRRRQRSRTDDDDYEGQEFHPWFEFVASKRRKGFSVALEQLYQIVHDMERRFNVTLIAHLSQSDVSRGGLQILSRTIKRSPEFLAAAAEISRLYESRIEKPERTYYQEMLDKAKQGSLLDEALNIAAAETEDEPDGGADGGADNDADGSADGDAYDSADGDADGGECNAVDFFDDHHDALLYLRHGPYAFLDLTPPSSPILPLDTTLPSSITQYLANASSSDELLLIESILLNQKRAKFEGALSDAGFREETALEIIVRWGRSNPLDERVTNSREGWDTSLPQAIQTYIASQQYTKVQSLRIEHIFLNLPCAIHTTALRAEGFPEENVVQLTVRWGRSFPMMDNAALNYANDGRASKGGKGKSKEV